MHFVFIIKLAIAKIVWISKPSKSFRYCVGKMSTILYIKTRLEESHVSKYVKISMIICDFLEEVLHIMSH